MIPVLCSAQARAFDGFVSQACAVPSLLLMENAGRSAAERVHAGLGARRRVVCLCGVGNNGGDGLVVARQLTLLGHVLSVVLYGRDEQLSPDARVNLRAWLGIGGSVSYVLEDGHVEQVLVPALEAADAVVDALFGTGLTRDLSGRHQRSVERLNHSRLRVFALDIPSGLNADTGAVMGVAVRAERTITFGHPKLGLLTTSAADYTGHVEIGGLGVPCELGPGREPRAWWLEAGDVAAWSVARARSGHKGMSGRVLIVAGSVGKTGAALLCSQAALRAGAGLVTIATFADAARSLDQRVVEVMTDSIDPDRISSSLERLLTGVDVVVIGPGLGLSEAARRVVDHVLLSWPGPKVVDADAITHFTGRGGELARLAAGSCLLTPHPGELGRLLGSSAAEVEADRFAALERAVTLTGQTVLLKGPHTLIGEPGSPPWVSSEGHAVLATGGSGDVLAGLCGACAVGLSLQRAAALATYLHGAAARLWVQAHAGADRGLLARELADLVPDARAGLTRAALAPPAPRGLC